ncbi:MAG: UbiA family prenyltransferase [Pseudomonadota bacterium]
MSEDLSRGGPVLVVDLDGTLLRSDMLHESFWSAFSKDWRNPFRSASALADGRAALKRYLADASQVDADTLPYNSRVIEFVKSWRESGGYTALVTASDMTFARAVSKHLAIFDEVHGSDGALNLKGETKADFLKERFGHGGFAYVGDAPADIAVWRHANKAITVNASAALRASAEKVSDSVEHLSSEQQGVKPYLRALRPHQWLKNTLVFLPMIAGHQFDAQSFFQSLLAFICFSVVASSVYVLNDLLDLSADRAHPRKKDRPFASGTVPIAHGVWMAVGLLVIGALLAITLGGPFFLVMAGYYLMTLAYSLYLKRRLVIDICVLAGLYTIRIIAGGAATGIPLSVWLLSFSVFFFLSLAAVKRQAELIDSEKRGQLKASGRGYKVDDLPIIAMVTIGAGYVAVLVMMLYVNAPNTVALYGRPEALWGVCAVLLYWITRTVILAHRGQMHDDPVVFAAKDRVSHICFLLILSFAVGGAIA